MSKNILSRIATAAIATAALTFTGAALAPTAFAASDAIEYAADDSVTDANINLDGEEITIDRSHLARTAPVTDDGSDVTFWDIDLDSLNVDHGEIETGEGYQNIMPLGGELVIDHPEIETGEGFQNIVPLGGLEIEPISAAQPDSGLSGAAIGGIVAGGVVVLGAAAYFVLRHRNARPTV
ncbi:MAG: hypothetical protein FWG25_08355 [Promicromonosporaceae bacterium]|nr:hypothetical protein [Promicromonosporaceae bacterium]